MKMTPKVFTIPGDGPGMAVRDVEERLAETFGYASAADFAQANLENPGYFDMVRKEAERMRLEAVQSRLENCGGGWPIRLLRKLHHYGLVGQEQPPIWAMELIASEIEAELDKPVR